MTNRSISPLGAPCWTDLWTSDVDGSRTFYSDLFGWEAQEPSPEFGGYFMFTRDGVPVTGGMGDMGDLRADDTWKIYFNTANIESMVREGEEGGAQISFPPSPVADLGVQTVFVDPTGAALGAWQAGSFPGFTVLGEPGTPSWFELMARDYETAIDFYSKVFQLPTRVMADSDEFRYTTLTARADGSELTGIMDASSVLPDGAPSYWITYWEVDDVDATTARLQTLGGSVTSAPADSPYGRIATVADPRGAKFRLRSGANGESSE